MSIPDDIHRLPAAFVEYLPLVQRPLSAGFPRLAIVGITTLLLLVFFALQAATNRWM